MVLAALFLSVPAYADVVGPEPEDCPSGSIGTASHAGEWCMPWLCAERACELGTTCENTGLCVLEEERACGGDTSGTPCTYTHREVFGPCETTDDCASGTCVTAEYCVEPAPPGNDTSGGDTSGGDTASGGTSDGSKGCSCSTGAGASMVFLLGLLPLLGARRRQR